MAPTIHRVFSTGAHAEICLSVIQAIPVDVIYFNPFSQGAEEESMHQNLWPWNSPRPDVFRAMRPIGRGQVPGKLSDPYRVFSIDANGYPPLPDKDHRHATTPERREATGPDIKG